jgi:hypothetical protein
MPEAPPTATKSIPPPAARPKAPKGAPKAPPPDPHAGHDMNKM